jgi:hypothetical protein
MTEHDGGGQGQGTVHATIDAAANWAIHKYFPLQDTAMLPRRQDFGAEGNYHLFLMLLRTN